MRKKRSRGSDGQTNNFWQSYSDLMAALLLAFILILSGTMLQAQRNYETSQQKLDDALATIDAQEEELKQVLGIRQSIIDALTEQFSQGEITVNPQNGAITFNSDVLFDRDEFTLKKAGKDFLRNFLPKYFGILLDEEFIDYVGEISIVGHTDTDGTYDYNLHLSANRALRVAWFIRGYQPTVPVTSPAYEPPVLSQADLDLLEPLLTVSGRSYSDAIHVPGSDTQVDMAASRRVEIQFHLKDEELIRLLQEAVS